MRAIRAEKEKIKAQKFKELEKATFENPLE